MKEEIQLLVSNSIKHCELSEDDLKDNSVFENLSTMIIDLFMACNNLTFKDNDLIYSKDHDIYNVMNIYITNNNITKDKLIDIVNQELCSYSKNIVKPPTYSESELAYLKNKIISLQNIPQPEQRTEAWYDFRRNRLTASNLFDILNNNSKRNEVILSKCSDVTNFAGGDAINHGIKFEPVATEIYEKRNDLNIIEFGCLPHREISYFGASPDGIVDYNSNNKNYIGRMLEIKCPKSRKITGIIPDGYYAQIQGQLEVCDLDLCDFLECDFQIYESKEAFFKDNKDSNNKHLNVNNKEKGIIIELYDQSIKKYVYYYNNKDHYNYNEFKLWEDSIISKVLENDTLDYVKTSFWYLNKYNVVLVKRDRGWFNNIFLDIKTFWEDVEKHRVNNGEDLKKIKKSRVYKNNEKELTFLE